jgi:hypothetical protein
MLTGSFVFFLPVQFFWTDSQSSGSSKELFNEWVPSASALASIEQNSRPAGIPTHLEGTLERIMDGV